MKINKIELYNIGSYEDLCSFDLASETPDQRIIIIGGKNGAGKTTLFTAMQVCLYGFYAFGYKSAGSKYFGDVLKFINNRACLKPDETAYVRIDFQHDEARDRTYYTIVRSWTWEHGNPEENLTITQNGIELPQDETLSFQNYLLHLIPPALLKLYFFDGEKIAKTFLNDDVINIRDALMVLSGNDTFDILHENIRRVIKMNKSADPTIADKYLATQSELSSAQETVNALRENYEQTKQHIMEAEAELDYQRRKFAEKGGITLEQWGKLQAEIKSEEDRRDRINSNLKALATDVIPFVILHELVDQLIPQIEAEDEYAGHTVLDRKLHDAAFRNALAAALKKIGVSSQKDITSVQSDIGSALLSGKWDNFKPILCLSNDEKMQIHAVLKRVTEFSPSVIKKSQRRLEVSLQKSKDIRAILQNSSVDSMEEFVRITADLESNIKILQAELLRLTEEVECAEAAYRSQEQNLATTKKAYETELKKSSITSLSGRVLLLLEDLQKNIYSMLITQVENDLKYKLNQLIRKRHFFDDIIIDQNFNVHIVRNQAVSVNDLIQVVKKGGQSALRKRIGDIAFDTLFDGLEKAATPLLVRTLQETCEEVINIPLEVSKESMSSGERQIFIMALYWALMQRSNNDLPFIIDTPFARIDSEHRTNITANFFLDLEGQLFILSTNEELDSEHMRMMSDQISHTYLLEYGDDKKTSVYANDYFEV